MATLNSTLTNLPTTLFTCSGVEGSKIASVIFTNHHTGNVDITLHICPVGETEDPENMVIEELEIPSKDTYYFDLPLILANTDEIKVFASVDGVIVATLSYMDL